MQTSLKQIEEQAPRLDPEDGTESAELMLESLSSPPAEVAEAWLRAIKQ